MSVKKRIEYLDVAKGIAILLVIAGHTISTYKSGTLINRWIYSFHMPLFFILSGYFYKPEPLKPAFFKRVRHLLIPYLTVSGIKCLLAFWQYGFTLSILKSYVLRTIYASGSSARKDLCLFPVQIVGMIWFLMALFCCQLLYLCLDEFARKYQIFLWIPVVLTALIGIELNEKVWLPFSLQPAMGALVFYHAGRCMREKKALESDLKEMPAGFLVLGFLLWILTVKYESLGMHANSYKGLGVIVTAVFATYIIVQLSKGLFRIPVAGRFLKWCGTNSLIIFAFHAIDTSVLVYLKSFVTRFYALPSKPGVILLYLVRAAVILSCTFLFLLVKKLLTSRRRA